MGTLNDIIHVHFDFSNNTDGNCLEPHLLAEGTEAGESPRLSRGRQRPFCSSCLAACSQGSSHCVLLTP